MRRPNVLETSDLAGLLRRFAARRYHGSPYDDPRQLQLEAIRRLRGIGRFALAGASYAEVGCVLRLDDSMLVLRLVGNALNDVRNVWMGATLTFDGGKNYGMKQILLGTEQDSFKMRAVALSSEQRYYEALQNNWEEGRPLRVYLSPDDEVRGVRRRSLVHRVLDTLVNGEPDMDAMRRWVEQANNADRPERVQPVHLPIDTYIRRYYAPVDTSPGSIPLESWHCTQNKVR